MRTFDLAPLYRSTVGFDRLFSLFDQMTDNASPRLSALQHRADRRERVSHHRCRRRLRRGRPQHRGQGKHADDPRREAGEDRRTEGRDALPGHRRARIRARVPARRLRAGEGRVRWRTVSCTSTSCAKSPRPRSRARLRSATARPRWSSRRLRKQATPLRSDGAPRRAGALSLWSAEQRYSVRQCQSLERLVHDANRIRIDRVRVLLPLAELERVIDHHPAPLEAAGHEILQRSG